MTVPKYSIVVPFHNEEENVTALYARLKQVMEQVEDAFELIFVDDGSRDRTYKLLEEIAEYFGGDRLVAVSRELTKMFEENLHGTVAELIETLNERTIKGEIVVVIKGKNN